MYVVVGNGDDGDDACSSRVMRATMGEWALIAKRKAKEGATKNVAFWGGATVVSCAPGTVRIVGVENLIHILAYWHSALTLKVIVGYRVGYRVRAQQKINLSFIAERPVLDFPCNKREQNTSGHF